MKVLGLKAKVALLAAAVLLCTAAGGAVAYRDFSSHAGNSSQCSLPVAERTGGWTCP